MFSAQLSAPAERNKQPILGILLQTLPPSGKALEIASGTGQHVAWFAAALPQWQWQPSDADDSAFDSVQAQVAQLGLRNVAAPVLLDVTAASWLAAQLKASQTPPLFDLIYCANMLHIAPWACCTGLMQGAARHLAPGGQLVTYGPYLEDGVPTSRGNAAFDLSLKTRNPSWGIRWREDVEQEAARAGLRLVQRFEMPANNLLLVWQLAA